MPYLLLAAVSCYMAWGFVVLTMSRHWDTLKAPHILRNASPLVLRSMALLQWGIALVLCLVRDGSSFDLLMWLVMTSISAYAVVMTVTWAPKLLRPLVWLATNLLKLKGGRLAQQHRDN